MVLKHGQEVWLRRKEKGTYIRLSAAVDFSDTGACDSSVQQTDEPLLREGYKEPGMWGTFVIMKPEGGKFCLAHDRAPSWMVLIEQKFLPAGFKVKPHTTTPTTRATPNLHGNPICMETILQLHTHDMLYWIFLTFGTSSAGCDFHESSPGCEGAG